MADANQAFFDALIRHQIGLLQVSGSVRNQLLAILDKTDALIREKILARLAEMTPGLSPANVSRMNVLSAIIENIRAKAWDEIGPQLIQSMIDVAKAEPDFTATAARTVSPATLDFVIPSVATLKALVTKTPFEGRLLKQWIDDIRAADLKRLNAALQIGLVQGHDAMTIARQAIGTKSIRSSNAELTRTQVQALVRTAINHVSGQARAEFTTQNSDIFSKEQYVATLDARTTPVCRANDGKIFNVGEGPMPPLHFNCRSTRVPVLDGTLLSQRPAVPATERQLAAEYSDQAGIDPVTSRDDMPYGHKGLFDDYAAKRIRELTGTVPESVSYQDWLTSQSANFQDDVLGPTRGALFRRGGLTLERFVNRAGDEISLHDLALREADAFIAAGFNPSDF